MKTFKLGLTGSIGMGKSTTAQMFRDSGCAVWDADAAVHRLYEAGGAAVLPIVSAFPQLSGQSGIDREHLRQIVSKDPSALSKIETIVHPLVKTDRQTFLKDHSEGIVVFDIPLLFETGGETEMDAVACVHVAPDVQKERVMARGTMNADQFEQIRKKQMPNDEKAKRSDYVISTDTLEHARVQVNDIIADIRKKLDA